MPESTVLAVASVLTLTAGVAGLVGAVDHDREEHGDADAGDGRDPDDLAERVEVDRGHE